MTCRPAHILGLFLIFTTPLLFADSQPDVKSRVRLFCDQKVKLTEQSIKLDVQSLFSLEAGNKAAAAVGGVSTVQIATMHLNCNLLVGGFINPEQFLVKQTEILQFAVDLQSVTREAEATKSSADAGSSLPKPASPNNTSTTATKDNGTTPTDKSGQTSSEPSAKKPGEGKPIPAKKPVNLDINTIAKDLGVKIKNKVAVSQSGNEDLILSGMGRIIHNYSPIPLNDQP
jgi:hypothetical protein